VFVVVVLAVMPGGVRRDHRTSQNDESNESENNATNLHEAPLKYRPLVTLNGPI
jgi:hypothetical protein